MHKLDRSFLPNVLFPLDALVEVLRPDGLVASTLKYLSGQPVIGVNPSPPRWDGVFLPFKVKDLRTTTPWPANALSDCQELHAVKDLYELREKAFPLGG